MRGSANSLAVRALSLLARVVSAYPRLFLYPQIILFFGCVAYTVFNLEFITRRDELVGADKEYHRNFLSYKRDFLVQPDLVTVVESEDTEKNRQFVERLGARLAAEPELFTDVLFNNDVKMLGDKALLFFPESDLRELRRTLADYRPFLQQFAEARDLPSLFGLVNRQFRTAKREASPETEALIKALPALRRIVEQATDSLRRPGLPPSPGLVALFDAGQEAERQIYITFDNGRLYLVTAKARSREENPAAIERLRELVEATRLEVPGVNAVVTGEPVLEYDEMRQAQRDTTTASVVALSLVAIIFIFGYQESGRPLKATLCLLVGLAYTMAYATATVGHLNVLTITFVPMLIGLAIDFGIHLVTRYEEELRHGRSEQEAIEKAITFTGQGIFTGSLTTSAAFFAMTLTDFRGIQEMGVICGGGLLVCLVPMMTLLPVLILRGRQNVLDHHYPAKLERRARIERLWLERPWIVLGFGAAFCGLAVVQSRHVVFDYNLLNLQTRDLPAVVIEQDMIESAEKSVLYGAVITESLEEALEVEAKVKQLSEVVSSADSMARYLTEDPTEKLRIIGAIKADLEGIHFQSPEPMRVDIHQLSRVLWSLQGYLGLAADEVQKSGEDPALEKELLSLRRAIGLWRREMLAGSVDRSAVKLAAFQQALFGDIGDTFTALRSQDNRQGLRVEDLPKALRNRFVSKAGDQHLVQVYPKLDVWQRTNQEEFVGQLRRTLDPDRDGKPVITGTPVQLLEYTTLLKESYEEAARYSLAAIAIMVLIHFRSFICVVLALLPVGVGTLWMVGVMGLFEVPFNPANIMTLPLVVGIGVTSGIHILNRFTEERTHGILDKSTGKAVLISAMTTIVGFGSLVLAKHQGVASLGFVMAVGTATCVVAALTLLPAALRLLTRIGWLRLKKKPSDQTGSSSLGWEEPR